MTRESKLRVTMVLGLFGLSLLFTAGLKRSSDHERTFSMKKHDLRPATPSFCQQKNFVTISRSIASGDEATSETSEETNSDIDKDLQQICENENRIANLKAELDELQKNRDDILALIERVQEKEEEKERKRKKKKVEDEDQAMLLLLANRYSMIQNQANMANQMAMAMPTPMVDAYSPLHNRTSQQNMQYLQMALMHRVNFSLQEDHYWHPEWNAQGQLTNPIYGTPQTWQNIESMYRDPVGSGVYQLNPQGTQTPLYHDQPSFLF